ncbi:MAG TPA: hypothetical protein VMP67_09240 [Candidatus Limnocylindria bacterium]|nr:hypothetical protein [Candidatus Limnocylindria bacterium]
MPYPSRRPAPARRPGRGAGRPQTRRRRSGARKQGRLRIGWSRRLGAALALLLLGGSLALASGALDGNRTPGQGPADPRASPAAIPPAPVLLPVEQSLVAAAQIDLQVELPSQLAAREGYRLRVYVNDELVQERRLPAGETADLAGVPLRQGPNWITAAIHGPGGESLHSTALLVERDDQPPLITLSAPDPARGVFTEQVSLRGQTEPHALLTVRNATTDQALEVEADGAGRFQLRLTLAMGQNAITLRSRDLAGNRSRATLRLRRVESRAEIGLEVTPAELSLEELPAPLRLVARIRGLRGEPLDGAQVTFSLSVPGQGTLTYGTLSSDGLASWDDVRIPADGARAGHGLATVMVVLPDGQGDELALQESASIRFR